MSRFERKFRRHTLGAGITGYNRVPESRTEAVALLLDHARSVGCTCNPNVFLPSLPRRGELTQITIAHDDGCPLAPRESP